MPSVEGSPPTADDVIRHLEHALNVEGEDHVAWVLETQKQKSPGIRQGFFVI